MIEDTKTTNSTSSKKPKTSSLQPPVSSLHMRHFRNMEDLSPQDCLHLVQMGLELKKERASGREKRRLAGRVLCLLFEKFSMRTRVSFESAMAHQGGSSIFLSSDEVGLGKRESIADFARVISTYIDVLAVRTFSDAVIEELAEHADCPVINALSDGSHPCQALGDLCTIQEIFGHLEEIRLVFIGDGNNVAQSLALAAAYSGIQFVLSSPPGYEFSAEFLSKCQNTGGTGTVTLESDPQKAVSDAEVVYTDVWTSMGQESEREERQKIFSPFQVDAQLFGLAKSTARFMHCLPAHRGEEVTTEVIDHQRSAVVQQAGNRLHAQKALLIWLLEA